MMGFSRLKALANIISLSGPQLYYWKKMEEFIARLQRLNETASSRDLQQWVRREDQEKKINLQTKKGTSASQTANVETGLHVQHDNG